MNKIKLTEKTITIENILLRQIVATESFKIHQYSVEKGQIGGYIDPRTILRGNNWIDSTSIVVGGEVLSNSLIMDGSRIKSSTIRDSIIDKGTIVFDSIAINCDFAGNHIINNTYVKDVQLITDGFLEKETANISKRYPIVTMAIGSATINMFKSKDGDTIAQSNEMDMICNASALANCESVNPTLRRLLKAALEAY